MTIQIVGGTDTQKPKAPAPVVDFAQKKAEAAAKAPPKPKKTLSPKQALARDIEAMGTITDHLHKALQNMTPAQVRHFRNRFIPILALLQFAQEDTEELVTGDE